MTALHYAVLIENVQFVKNLLALGADPLIVDIDGSNAFDLATEEIHVLLENHQATHAIKK